MSTFFSRRKCCLDDNPKTVTRVYNWDGKEVRIELCEQHRKDPDFAGFVVEYQKEQVAA